MFHPFYVKNEDGTGQWKAASNLEAGDELLTEDGKKVFVSEVRVEKLEEEITVYNLELDEVHTYYVALGVLVHNMCATNKNKKENAGGSAGGSGTSSTTYYHVTTEEAAKSIMETGQLKNSKWEAHVFAWTQQPTKKQASIAGLGDRNAVVLAFETTASFIKDEGNTKKSISHFVVQTVDGERLPINITNVRKVGFKKPWWKIW